MSKWRYNVSCSMGAVIICLILMGSCYADSLTNPEFEQESLNGWDIQAGAFSVGVTTNTTFNRNYAARVHGTYAQDNWTTGILSQTISAKSGNDVYASGFVYWKENTAQVATADAYVEACLDGPFGRESTIWTNVQDMWTFFSMTGSISGVSEGGFETATLAGWYGSFDQLAGVVSTNFVFEGNHALHIYGDWKGWGMNYVYQFIQAETDDVLIANGRILIEELKTTPEWVLAGIKIEKDGGGQQQECMFGPETTTNQWLEFSINMTITNAGTYKLLCGVMGGNNSTSSASVYFDDIRLYKQDNVPGYMFKTLGINDGSHAEFKTNMFPVDPIDLDTETVSVFPKELNDSWHATQQFYMVFDTLQASRDLDFILDSAWSMDEGSLTVAVDVQDRGSWIQGGTADINSMQIGTVTVAAAYLSVGQNDFRLRTVSANGETHALTWDQIRIESQGIDNPTYDVTLSVQYHGYSGGESYVSEVDLYADAFTVLGSTALIGNPSDIMDVLSTEVRNIALNPAIPIPEVKYPKKGTYGFVGYPGHIPTNGIMNFPGYVEAPVMGWEFKPFTNEPPIIVTNNIYLSKLETNGPAYLEFDSYQYIGKYSHTPRGAPLQFKTNEAHFKLGERDNSSEEFGNGPFNDVHTYVVGTSLTNFPRRLSTEPNTGWPVHLQIVFEEDFRLHSLSWDKYFVIASVITNGADSNVKRVIVNMKNELAHLEKKSLDVDIQDIHMGWGTDAESWGRIDYPNLTYQDRNMVHIRSSGLYGLANAPGWYVTQTQRASATVEPMTLYVLRDGAWVQQMYEEYFFLWPSAASGVRSIFDDDTKIRLDGPGSYYVSYKMGHANGTNEFGDIAYWQLFEARGCAYYRMTDYHGVMAGSLRPMAANVFGLYGREETFLMPNSYTRIVPRTTPTNEPDDSYAEVYAIVRSRTNQAYIGAVKTAFHMSTDEVATNGAYFDVEMDTWANRDVVLEEEGPLCLFAQASMHWRGDDHYEINDFDEAHDIDTVMVQKPDGEWISHQMLNPPTGIYHRTLCDFELGDVIYLQQQDRGLYSYGYVPEAPYQQASSFEITLLDDPAQDITVDVYESHTAGEYADNVDITCNLNEGMSQGDNLHYTYRYRTVFAPGVTIAHPNETCGGENWSTNHSYHLEFYATDPLETSLYANIYYGNGRDDDWTLINTEGIIPVSEESNKVVYEWDVSAVPPGAYYIKATAQTGDIARVGFDVSNTRLQIGNKIGLSNNVPLEEQVIVTGDPYQGNDMGFETGDKLQWGAATNWNEDSAYLVLSVTNDPVYEGEYSLQMQGEWTNWGWNSAWQEIPCEEGEVLQISGRVYIDELTGTDTFPVVCGIKMESVDPVGRTQNYVEFNDTAPTHEWLAFYFNRPAPVTGADKLILYVCGNHATGINVYFDDLKIVSTNHGSVEIVQMQNEFWRHETGVDMSSFNTLRCAVQGTNNTEQLQVRISDVHGVTNSVFVTNFVDRVLSMDRAVSIPLTNFNGLDLTQIQSIGYTPNRCDLTDAVFSGMQVEKVPIKVDCCIAGAPALDFESTPLFNRGETVTNIMTIQNVSEVALTNITIQAIQEYAEMKFWYDIPEGHGDPHWSAAMRAGDQLNGDFKQIWTNQSIPAQDSLILTNIYMLPVGKHMVDYNFMTGEKLFDYYVFANYACRAQVHLVIREAGGDNVFAESQVAVYAMDDDFDIDDDGMTDDWETLYFGERTAALPDDDYDEDGFTNLEEFELGTDPTDPLSYPEEALQLTVAGSPDAFGESVPYGYGVHNLLSNSTVQLSVASPVEIGDEQYTCLGWVLEGLTVQTGISTDVEFVLQTNTVLTWVWDMDYALKEVALLSKGEQTIIDGFETNISRIGTVWGNFGCQLALDGGYLAVGVDGADGAYVYRQAGQEWVLNEKLTGNDTAFGNQLNAVDIQGALLIAGCWQDDDSGSESGSAYIFSREGMSWTQEVKLVGSDLVAADRFGWAVSLDGDTSLIGAPGPYHGSHPGAVYVFRNTGGWIEEQKLMAGDGAAFNEFGAAVELDEDLAVVGAFGHTVQTETRVGAAYAYRYADAVWTEEAVFTNPAPSSSDDFGFSVAVQDDFIFIGAPGEDEDGADVGRVYVYVRRGKGWIQSDVLSPAGVTAGGAFGTSLAVKDDLLAVGAAGDQGQGTVYLFRRIGREWVLVTCVTSQDGVSGDCYGSSVALDRQNMAVGAPGANGLGVVYIRTTCELIDLVQTWVAADSITNTVTAPDVITNAADLVFSFAGWEVDGAESNGNPLTGLVMDAPLNAMAIYTRPSEYVEFILGDGDQSYSEFMPPNYPNGSLDLNQIGASGFPDELNDSWWQTQTFHFVVSEESVDKTVICHLCPAFCSGTSYVAVAVDYWDGQHWQQAGRADINDELEADIELPASRLFVGTNNFRLHTCRGYDESHALKWDQIVVESVGYQKGVVFALGSNDASDAEFLASGFPTEAINLDLINAAGFPKELNSYGDGELAFFFTLSALDAAHDINVWMDTHWSDGSGWLNMALDVKVDGDWKPIKEVPLSGSTSVAITVYSSDLFIGRNDMQLRLVSAQGDTHVVTWDQIIIESGGIHQPALFALGSSDSSDSDFLATGFPGQSLNLNVASSSEFPKELNDNWWSNQYFHVSLNRDEVTRGLVFTLNPYWSQSNETLTVALDRFDGANWINVGVVDVCDQVDGQVTVPSEVLTTGRNEFRFRTILDAGGTHALTWDQLLIASESLWLQDGDQDGLRDGWEIQFGLDQESDDSGEDSDGDGADNISECIAGTNPLEPDSCFACDPASMIPGYYHLYWPGAQGRLYDIYESTNIHDGFSLVISDLPATLPISSVNVSCGTEPVKYFRIRAKKAE